MVEQRERWFFLLALGVIALYVSPLFLLGENAHIRVHDNLDSNIAWYKVLSESGKITGPLDANIPQIANGQLSRNALGSELTGIVWLHALFPTMTAYALSQTITRVVGFLGMYLLLKTHFLTDPRWMAVRIGVALAFALTLFWPSGMLSTLGMPLALWAFLSIRKGEGKWKHYAALTLLPFYSNFVLGFFFFLAAMGVLWLADVLRGKGWNIRFLTSIAYMTLLYLLVEYRLVYSFLWEDEPT
ncbi:DUF6044 family protein, partial [Geobacillus stearothermophilus]|uniref:DUF6044 family protein n=1 Tax=Geobacillus stearothermophilus TaxID=1422 RepID=UPI001F168B2A